VSPDQPSPESKKLAESLVLLEFVADLYPNSTLLPKDPVARAQARFFIDTVSTKYALTHGAFMIRGEPVDKFFEGVKAVQSLLPANSKYALGDEFTIADAAILPFIARAEIAMSNDIGKYPEGEGSKAYQKLSTDPEYARFWKYFNDLKTRESFKKTFDPVSGLYLSLLISPERFAMHRIT
jgi:glutathione S-transferase